MTKAKLEDSLPPGFSAFDAMQDPAYQDPHIAINERIKRMCLLARIGDSSLYAQFVFRTFDKMPTASCLIVRDASQDGDETQWLGLPDGCELRFRLPDLPYTGPCTDWELFIPTPSMAVLPYLWISVFGFPLDVIAATGEMKLFAALFAMAKKQAKARAMAGIAVVPAGRRIVRGQK